MVFIILILLLVGVFAGFMAGLLGGDEEMLMAVGTSMMVIIVNAMSASYAHYNAGAIQFDLVKRWAIFIVCGVLLGCYLAVHLPEKVLVGMYALYLFIVACRFFYKANFEKQKPQKKFFHPYFEYLVTAMIGLFSSLFGIGGGVFRSLLWVRLE